MGTFSSLGPQRRALGMSPGTLFSSPTPSSQPRIWGAEKKHKKFS